MTVEDTSPPGRAGCAKAETVALMFGLLASLVNLQHLLAVLRSVEGCCLVFVIREPNRIDART